MRLIPVEAGVAADVSATCVRDEGGEGRPGYDGTLGVSHLALKVNPLVDTKGNLSGKVQ